MVIVSAPVKVDTRRSASPPSRSPRPQYDDGRAATLPIPSLGISTPRDRASRRASQLETRGPSRPGSRWPAAGSGSRPASSEGAPAGRSWLRSVTDSTPPRRDPRDHPHGVLELAQLHVHDTEDRVGSACRSSRYRRSTTTTDSPWSSLAFSSSGVIRAIRSRRRNRCPYDLDGQVHGERSSPGKKRLPGRAPPAPPPERVVHETRSRVRRRVPPKAGRPADRTRKPERVASPARRPTVGPRCVGLEWSGSPGIGANRSPMTGQKTAG
jgi:hypothetical protein